MKKRIAIPLGAAVFGLCVLSAAHAQVSSHLTDGTYEGKAAHMTVEVTVKEKKIEDIQITNVQDMELKYADMLLPMAEAIMKTQSTDVDAVSGATVSSNEFKMAVEAALDKARVYAAAMPPEEKPFAVVQDGVLGFTVRDIDGEEIPLSRYKGKVLLIVNTASRCGFTPQLGSLQTLYEKYKVKGLEIIAFPANNFMNQEPGTNAEIKDFCFRTYKTTFPLFAKISVRGADMHPLYQFLTERAGFNGPITWNFNKFLVDKDGRVVQRFPTRKDPLDPGIQKEIETYLAK